MADTDVEYLKPKWDLVCKELAVAEDAQASWWESLVKRHSEPQRAYHTLSHLSELFGYVEEHKDKIADMTAMVLAIFFHDAIYNARAGSPKNEMDSANVFDKFGQEAIPDGDPPGLAKGELIAKVRKWIVQTATHKVSESDDSDCKAFMDFDMAVLGRPWEKYLEYSKQIRQEYIHVPEAVFCKARSAFLSATAAGPAIFVSGLLKEEREKVARENMAREAALLQEKFASLGLGARLSAELTLKWIPKVKKMITGRVKKGGMLALTAAAGYWKPRWLYRTGVTAVGGGLLFALRWAFGAPYVRYPYPEPKSSAGTVVLAGSYNPPHLGHLEMLKYLSKAHSKVVAIIGINPNKKYDVNPYQRQALLRVMIKDAGLTNVEVKVWGSIIFLYAQSIGASVMYRGIRTWKEDGKAEKHLEFQNLYYQLLLTMRWPIPTAYLQGAPALTEVSSTLLRKRIAAEEDILDLVPKVASDAVVQAYRPPPKSDQ
mmetsp:Transcript_98778/g.174292  ORF Transcript_98778/g.174292 Transcript_98778/m.174292 type:complete len:486 (+) Transcript_98778:59-1516(+)